MKKLIEKFQVVAEDYHSPFFRNSLFINATSGYKKLLGIQAPRLAIVSHQDKIQYLTQPSTWERGHNQLKQMALNDYDFLEKIIDLADHHGNTLNKWTEQNIFNVPLQKYSSKKLIALYKRYILLEQKVSQYGVIPVYMDFHGFSLVENTVKEFLQRSVPKEKYQHYFMVFTEPIANSFSQDQEENLLRLIAKYYHNNTWRSEVTVLDLDALKKKYPQFYKDLQKHTARHAWVYYAYNGPAYSEANFLAFILESLKNKTSPQNRLKQLNEKKQKIKQLKNKYLKQLKPGLLETKMLSLAGKFVWAKPRRKDYESKSYYHVEKLQREIAHRLYLSLEQVRSLPIEKLERFLTSTKVRPEIANEIFRLHICVHSGEGKTKTYTGDEAEKFIKLNIKSISQKRQLNQETLHELTGQTAFPGLVKGMVKIINTVEEMHKMNSGDILVSFATTPSIVPAMKKAAAILTDEGGLTCHASIVSREMEIPCIVGLKVATKVFKDGDMVTVNATTGVVTKL